MRFQPEYPTIKGIHVQISKNIFIIGFPFRTIEMLKDKNENLEISIDTLEKSNSVLHQSNNNLQQARDPRAFQSKLVQILNFRMVQNLGSRLIG